MLGLCWLNFVEVVCDLHAFVFRLTKYPLLFENLAKYTSDEEELSRLKVAIERSKDLLNHVDMAVKEAEDEHRLAEIQRRLDKSPFDKVDHPIAQEFKV